VAALRERRYSKLTHYPKHAGLDPSVSGWYPQSSDASGVRWKLWRKEYAMKIELTPKAVAKVKEIMAQQNPVPAGLRVAVVGGGCSGFSYQMNFENQTNGVDKTYEFDGLKVFVDQASLMYINGTKIDYVETLEGAGFKFENPNVKTTCGCGSSFSA
jgi:iron-sulfur cluster assembly accessory protein